MMRHLLKCSHRRLLAGVLYAALIFQALIPAGFMPASDGSFALQVCHSGLPEPAQSGGPDHRSKGHAHIGYCPFGALPGAAPIPNIAGLLPSSSTAAEPTADFALQPPETRLHRAHPARGPPAV
jgi:hypothetical protein